MCVTCVRSGDPSRAPTWSARRGRRQATAWGQRRARRPARSAGERRRRMERQSWRTRAPRLPRRGSRSQAARSYSRCGSSAATGRRRRVALAPRGHFQRLLRRSPRGAMADAASPSRPPRRRTSRSTRPRVPSRSLRWWTSAAEVRDARGARRAQAQVVVLERGETGSRAGATRAGDRVAAQGIRIRRFRPLGWRGRRRPAMARA